MKFKILLASYLFILIVIIMFIPFTVAYVKPYDYNGVKVYYYGNTEEWNCTETFDKIDLKYYEGISYIRVFPEQRGRISGRYWVNRGIDLLGTCRISTVTHELAHHCQYKRQDRVYYMMNHIKNFMPCVEDIKKNYS